MAKAKKHVIQLLLRDIRQLFNSLDPSPFHEKDLNREAEEFIVSWAREGPKDLPVALSVLVDQEPAEAHSSDVVAEAVRNYFSYQAQLKTLEFRELMRRGRRSLSIGLAFLALCMLANVQLERAFETSQFMAVVRESLLIGGWVSMWKPIEIFLYDWWPIRRARRLFLRLAEMDVEVKVRERLSTT